MKRTDLIALADLAVRRDPAAIARLVDFARQIAESQPVAWRFEVRFCDPNPLSKWMLYNTTDLQTAALKSVESCGGGIEGRAVPLYTLPLED